MLNEALRSFVDATQTDWDRYLPSLQFAYNTAKHTSTDETPFFLNYGPHPIAPSRLIGNALPAAVKKVPALAEFVKELQSAMAEAKSNLTDSQDRQKKVADRRRQDQRYAVGDRVLLSTANLAVPPNLTRKLRKLYEGPFYIEECKGENAHKLTLSESVNLHPVFNVSQLRPYIYPSGVFPGRTIDPSPPVVVDGDDEYEVEAVLGHRDAGRQRRREYLVKWKGYSALHNTWERAENLQNAEEEVDRYLQRSKKTKPRRAKRARERSVSTDRGVPVGSSSRS